MHFSLRFSKEALGIMTTAYQFNADNSVALPLEPLYDIVITWDSGVPKFHHLPTYTVSVAKDIARALGDEYNNKQRFNMHRTDIPRYEREYIESACVFLKKMGISTEVQYNDFKDNHCHIITLRRR